jgi:FkbM family methyltransferase
VFELLAANVERWRAEDELAPITTHREALSDSAGTAELEVSPAFFANMGLAAVRTATDASGGTDAVTVALRRLDEVVGAGPIGMLKVDVEGHEPAVLRGAGALLAEGLVRDVVFEDHDPYPSEATEIVEAAGYRVLSLENDLLGLRLGAPGDRGETAAWPGPSYLATREATRALERLRVRGWQVRGIGPRLRVRGWQVRGVAPGLRADG